MLVGPAAAVLWAAAVAITSVYALEEQEQQQRDEFPFLSPAEQEQRQHEQQRKSCPGYLMYSQDDKHEPYSPGKWRLPYQRPTPECRTWTSPEVEEAIRSMKTVIKDPDLYRLFENTYPNTLDTTIRWHGFANGTDEEVWHLGIRFAHLSGDCSASANLLTCSSPRRPAHFHNDR